MKAIENIINDQTYMVIDHPANRFNFCGLVEVTEDLAEEASCGTEWDLSDDNLPEDVQNAINTMIENHVEIKDYTSITTYDDGDNTYYLLAW